jgi:hypothetical protein
VETSQYRNTITFIVTEENSDHLTRLYQKHCAVEEIREERGCPEGVHLTHKIVFRAQGRGVDLLRLEERGGVRRGWVG